MKQRKYLMIMGDCNVPLVKSSIKETLKREHSKWKHISHTVGFANGLWNARVIVEVPDDEFEEHFV
jgi:type III secretory pathway lipoprotein EscJ